MLDAGFVLKVEGCAGERSVGYIGGMTERRVKDRVDSAVRNDTRRNERDGKAKNNVLCAFLNPR